MRISNDSLTKNGLEIYKNPVDLTTGFNSDPIWLGHMINFTIQLVFTGSPVGTFHLQVSADKGHSSKGEGFYDLQLLGNWTDVQCSQQKISASGDHMWEFQGSGARWARFIWTPTGGSGTLTSAHFNAKGIS